MAARPTSRTGIPPLENGDRLSLEEFERRYFAMPENVRAELIDGQVYLQAEYPANMRFPGPGELPILENGDHLSREEFHRRYEAMPDSVHAELINGVVYLASPVSLKRHGRPHGAVIGWLLAYESGHPDVEHADNTTIILDSGNEPQPDGLLRYLDGQTTLSEEGYVLGAPELVAEVASSSVSYDMNAKLEMYREHGALEYVVWRVRDNELDWFILRNGVYQRLQAGDDGIVRSETFPGLRLNVRALLEGDFATVLREQFAENERSSAPSA